jgi:hypothetical protein
MCTCKQGIANTGTPNCSTSIEVPVKLFVQSLYDSEGNKNMIDLSVINDPTDLDNAFFSAMINDTDKSKRLFPFPKMKNVENTRGENRLETFKDGSKLYIGQGTRTFKALIVGKEATPQLAGKLESLRCTDFGIYMAGQTGSFIGSDATAGYLQPINIDQDSFSAKYMPPTDDAVQKIEISFDFDVTEYDQNLRAIQAEEMTCDVRELRGLLDVYYNVVSCSTTTLICDLYTDYGTALNRIPVEGLVASDFISSDTLATSNIYDITDNSDLSITASESATIPGRYTLTYSGAVSSELIQVLGKKDGFDFTPMLNTQATVA